MRNIIFTCILYIVVFSSNLVFAETIVSNTSISENTIFLKSKSPYVFSQNITVQQGVTLTIEQGVKLIFNQGGLFINKGNLVGNDFSVESKASNYTFLIQCNTCSMNLNIVTVTGIPRSFISAWNQSKVTLNGIDINFSTSSPNITGVEVFNKTVLTITNSTFTKLTKALDIFDFSSSTITNSFFTYNSHAIYTFDSNVDVHESDFEYNHIAIEFFANLDVFPIVDAHNNWWGQGDPSPIYRDDGSNVKQDDINAIVGVVIYAPWSTVSHKNKETIGGISNVLFLPGLMGSRLYKKETFENQLWEPNRNKDVTRLFLNIQGKSVEQNIYTRDIISKTNIIGGISNIDQLIYKDFNTYMDQLVKTKVITAWKAAPYDWRYSPDTILQQGIIMSDGKNVLTQNLVSEVIALAKISKSKKVTLVTHSNGGLVGKQLMIELKKQKLDTLIDKIIFVALPEYGTPQGITSLLYGHEQTIGNGLILRTSVAKEFGMNMSSAYTLLPSEKYFAQGKPFFIDQIQINSKTQLNEILQQKGTINNTLLMKADAMRVLLDAWTPPPTILVYQIVGTGLLTVSGIMKDSKGNPLPQYSTSGDGTVQDMYNSTTQAFGRSGKVFIANLHNTKFKHSNIMNYGGTMTYLDLLIRKNPTEAAQIPFGQYPIYPDTFTLFTLTSSTTPLSQKTLQVQKEEGRDTLKYNPEYQFDTATMQNSDARYDLFNSGIQYITYKPIDNVQIIENSNDIFDFSVYSKTVGGMNEIQYADVALFQDSVLSVDFTNTETLPQIDIHLPMLNQHMQTLPTEKNTYTSSGKIIQSVLQASSTLYIMDIVEKITRVKSEIKISSITSYVKDRYIRRLDAIQKTKDEGALASLKKSIEQGIQTIDRFAHNPRLRQKYAKLKQDYIYIVYLLK